MKSYREAHLEINKEGGIDPSSTAEGQTRDLLKRAVQIIRKRYPELFDAIRNDSPTTPDALWQGTRQGASGSGGLAFITDPQGEPVAGVDPVTGKTKVLGEKARFLRESAFDTIVPANVEARLQDEFDPIAQTQEGQLQILDMAESGDSDAAMYLFSRYRKLIAKAFWKYYMGPNKRFHRSRLASGDDQEFASVAFEMLLGGAMPSPYKTFNPDKFSASTDLIKQFSYYIYRYLQNEAHKMNRATNMQGMVGNVGASDSPSITNYDDNELSVPSSAADIDHRATVDQFVDWLSEESQVLADTFAFAQQGMSAADIATELGLTTASVYNYVKRLGSLWRQFTQ